VRRLSTSFLQTSYLSLFLYAAYFVITEPTSSTQWKNGEAHVVTWSKGGDDITGFDVELARLGDDGLIYVARDGEYCVVLI